MQVHPIGAPDPDDIVWSPIAPMLHARWMGFTAATAKDGRIFLIGGCVGPPGNHGCSVAAPSPADVYDPAHNTWTTIGSTLYASGERPLPPVRTGGSTSPVASETVTATCCRFYHPDERGFLGMRRTVNASYRVALAVWVAVAGLALLGRPPAGANAAASSVWYWQNPLPRGHLPLGSVACVSVTSCVAAGPQGSIALTENGGVHWTDAPKSAPACLWIAVVIRLQMTRRGRTRATAPSTSSGSTSITSTSGRIARNAAAVVSR